MTYTLSTLKESTAEQTMNETHTNPQTIKIHLHMLRMEKNKQLEVLGASRNTQQTVLGIFVNIYPPLTLSSEGLGFVGLAQEPG